MTHLSCVKFAGSKVSGAHVYAGEIPTIGRKATPDVLARFRPDTAGYHFGAAGDNLAGNCRQAFAGSRGQLVLVAIIAQQALVSFSGFRIAELFVALANFQQSLCCHGTIPGIFLHDALVELDGLFQLAFHQLLLVSCFH